MPDPKKKVAIISIRGPIGRFAVMGDDGKPVTFNGMKAVNLISQVTKLPDDITDLVVEIGGLGGSVPVAKAMRGYLKSLKSTYKLTTKQVDDLASAHTFLFSVGDDRLVPEPGTINPETGVEFRNMVHPPWITHMEGNADKLEDELADMRLTEEEVVGMYVEDGMDEKAVRPLMKTSSVFNSQQALDLRFATGTYKVLNQAAYKTNNNMADKKKAAKGSKMIPDWLAAALETAGIKIQTDGTIVGAAPPAELMGKTILIDGQPAVDGVYTVVGGVITALAEAAAPGQADEPAAAGSTAAPGQAGPVAAGTQAALKLQNELLQKLVAALPKKEKPNPLADEDEDEDEDEVDGDLSKKDKAFAAAIVSGIIEGTKQVKGAQRTNHVPPGFKPENKVALAAEWDKAMKENRIKALKAEEPEKYVAYFFAKYGKRPVGFEV